MGWVHCVPAVLSGGEYRQMVAAVAQPEVESGFAGVDIMVDLLGYHRHMGRLVELVASASVFMCVVVFESELRIVGSAQECAGSECLCLQLCHFGESVVVVVVSVAIAALAINEYSGLVVVGHYRGVDGSVVVHSARGANRSECMSYSGRVGQGVLCNDIYCAAHGRRAEEGRASAAHHLDPLNHVGRYLLQAVYSGEG